MSIEKIIEYIIQSDSDISEYQLIKYIDAEVPIFFKPIGTEITLFRKHFYLFHMLYTANRECFEEGRYLSISPLNISMVNQKPNRNELAKIRALESFYCDKANLELSEEEVNKMLLVFWEKFMAIDKKAEAIVTLELQEHPKLTMQLIKRQYNKLAQKAHPDKGGSIEKFNQLNQAYEILKTTIS